MRADGGSQSLDEVVESTLVRPPLHLDFGVQTLGVHHHVRGLAVVADDGAGGIVPTTEHLAHNSASLLLLTNERRRETKQQQQQ